MKSDDVGVDGKMMQLQLEFGNVFTASGPARRGAAMFGEHTPGRDFEHFYFSPQAVTIARNIILAYGGVPCEQPVFSDEVNLCVGSSGDRERLLRAPENS
jgi:hypothetical protein